MQVITHVCPQSLWLGYDSARAAVPCHAMPDFGDHHCIVHIQVRLWERYVVTARSKEMHKPVDVATYILLLMAPVVRNFRC